MEETAGQNKLWTGSFIRICLVNLFIFVNFHALLPTFPFFVTYLGGDAVTIGLATALFSVASIVSRPFVGWLIDTRGRCTILVLGLVRNGTYPDGIFCIGRHCDGCCATHGARGVSCGIEQRLLHLGDGYYPA